MDIRQGPAPVLPGSEWPTADLAGYVVGEAVWAPSVHNTQPWWYALDPGGLRLYADPRRRLPVADPAGREMLISCGAALLTARLALRAVGYEPRTEVLPDPARPLLVARLSWHRGADPAGYERRLSAAVRQRRTHRGGFSPLPVSPDLLALLQEAAACSGAVLRVITDEGARRALAEAVQVAERALELDPAYVRELTTWTPAPGRGRPDGVPATAYPAHAERTCPHFPSPDFARGRGWGHQALSTAAGRSAGVVCLLETSSDSPRDWVNAGQALQRILLTCTTWGLAAALHSQPYEADWGRTSRHPQSNGSGWPQLLLRIGTTVQAGGGVRRARERVLSLAGGEPPGRGGDA